jgi:hypothetical protein
VGVGASDPRCPGLRLPLSQRFLHGGNFPARRRLEGSPNPSIKSNHFPSTHSLTPSIHSISSSPSTSSNHHHHHHPPILPHPHHPRRGPWSSLSSFTLLPSPFLARICPSKPARHGLTRSRLASLPLHAFQPDLPPNLFVTTSSGQPRIARTQRLPSGRRSSTRQLLSRPRPVSTLSLHRSAVQSPDSEPPKARRIPSTTARPAPSQLTSNSSAICVPNAAATLRSADCLPPGCVCWPRRNYIRTAFAVP